VERLRHELQHGGVAAAVAATGGAGGGAGVGGALQHLGAVASHLVAMGLPANRVAVHPLLPPPEPYHCAAFFELTVRVAPPGSGGGGGGGGGGAGGGGGVCVAAGGRYDAWLAEAYSGAHSVAPGGCGVSVAVRKAAALAGSHARSIANIGGAAAATDVLVCARGGGGMLGERLALTAELWAAGVRAEVVAAAAPSPTEQFEHAAARGARYMVTIDSALLSASERVRVKPLLGGGGGGRAGGLGAGGGGGDEVDRDEVVELLRGLLSGAVR
jgi:translation initiation factor 2-alpha kinase 4